MFHSQLSTLKSQIQQGYVALTTIIIISAVMLTVLGTISYLSIGEAQSTLALTQGEGSLNLAEGCAEDALLNFQVSGTYSGGLITRPEGTCSIIVNSGIPDYDITVSATPTDTTLLDYPRRVQIKFTRTTAITISSWQEI